MAAEPRPMLRLDGLVTGYGRGRRRRVVAQGLTAKLPAGTLTALLGTNGAGKSTLLRTLCGLQPPLGGQALWAGRALADFTARELARTVSIVLTRQPVVEGMTALDVALLGRTPHTGLTGRCSEHDVDVARRALALTGAEAFAHRPMGSLSDGERQRVMLARALAQQTPAILLDEPTAFLDFEGKVATLRLLGRLAAQHGKTILFSTHDLELTFQCVERLWLLSAEGIDEGSPAALASAGRIEQFFAAGGARFDRQALRFQL